MKPNKYGAALVILLSWFTLSASAQPAPRISDLSHLDRQYMQQQRDLLDDLCARNYGQTLTGDKYRDLGLLQRLLDDRLVRNNQTRELQAMGIVMGDLLAHDLGLHWVIYEDSMGRSRALRYSESDNYLFPVTMISRRREVDNQTPVTEIYRKAEEAIAPVIPALPFQ